MLYGLMIISLIVFWVFGDRMMSRLDRFLGPKKAAGNRKIDKHGFGGIAY